MNETKIEEQIIAIREATKEAAKTKESALKFLQDAGIIETISKSAKAN